jgi:hypothetical protein
MSQASAGPDEPTTLPVTNTEQLPGPAWVDLASHRPGHAVLAHIASLLTPARNDVQPAGSGPNPEGVEPWAVGFVGEEKVGLELALLDERWRVLHGVPIGHEGSDIDHVVIGPPGVFTINTKHHRGKAIDVRGDAVFIGRNYQRYVPNARHEADCARSALTADLPTPCPVTPVICTVGATLRHREATSGVWVVEDHRLIASLTSQHAVLSPAQVDWLYDRARRSTTWTSTPPPAPAPAAVAEYARLLATPPARALAATASARNRPGARVGRPAPAKSRRASARRRRFAPTRSPSRLLISILVLAAFLLVGPHTITAVTRAITGPLVAALPTIPAAPGTDQGGTPPQYLASDDLPIAAVGGSCLKKKTRARYPLGDHLLLCRPDADKELTWQFADPWRRLPAALKGTACNETGDHAQSVTERRTALSCAKDEQGNKSWIPDPGWEPKP